MEQVALANHKQFLRNLFMERRGALEASTIGKVYAISLDAKPLVEELKDTDTDHDDCARALYHLTEAYIRYPKTPPEVRESAKRVRQAFVPELSEVRDRYPVEAERCFRREPQLEKRQDDLDALPVVGGTAAVWATDLIIAGKRISELMSARATATPAARKDANRLRASTIALIGRFRASLADELAARSDLPPNLDKQIFAYLDELTS